MIKYIILFNICTVLSHYIKLVSRFIGDYSSSLQSPSFQLDPLEL